MSSWKNGNNERTRTCDESPFSYEHFETESWGCFLFGEECVRNKKFDDDVCYVHPKKLQHLAKERNKRMISLEKECFKYRPEYRKPVTSSKFIQGPYHSGYEVVANADFLCSLNKHYRPNMKGGHRHNHIRNAHKRMRKCHVCGEPIVKGCEVLGYRFSEFQCRGCRTEECLEQACLVGLSFGGCEFEIRRRRK